MARRVWASLLFTSVLIVGGCGGGSGDDDDDLIFEVDARPPPPDAAQSNDHDSFDEAAPIDIGAPGTPGAIDVPGDQDFFVFEGTAGQWLEISALPDDYSSELFPIVTLFDADERQVAEGFIVTTHLVTSGTYYVKVEDYSSILGNPAPFGSPDETYTFDLVEPVDGVDDNYFDTELGDDAASARPFPTSSFFFTDLLGVYDHAGDRDVYSLTLTGSGVKWFSAYVAFPGTNGNGATCDYQALWVTDATGSEILARVDYTAFDLNPPLPSPATYLLWVEKDTAAPSTNDFYEVNAFGGFDDDAFERETLALPGTNDTIELADANDEVVPLGTSATYFITYLPAGDVDYVAFDATSALAIEAYCVANSSGSGLIGMTAQIRDSSDTILSTATEPGLDFLDTTLPAAGRYYFRLSAAEQDPEVSGNWVRCNISIPSF